MCILVLFTACLKAAFVVSTLKATGSIFGGFSSILKRCVSAITHYLNLPITLTLLYVVPYFLLYKVSPVYALKTFAPRQLELKKKRK